MFSHLTAITETLYMSIEMTIVLYKPGVNIQNFSRDPLNAMEISAGMDSQQKSAHRWIRCPKPH